LPDGKHKIEDLAKRLEIETHNLHSASEDARVLSLILEKLIAKANLDLSALIQFALHSTLPRYYVADVNEEFTKYNSNETDLKQFLSNLKLDSLKKIARQIKMKNYSSDTKRSLQIKIFKSYFKEADGDENFSTQN
jgi:DNA polymerase III epsilon subunit-like protein